MPVSEFKSSICVCGAPKKGCKMSHSCRYNFLFSYCFSFNHPFFNLKAPVLCQNILSATLRIDSTREHILFVRLRMLLLLRVLNIGRWWCGSLFEVAVRGCRALSKDAIIGNVGIGGIILTAFLPAAICGRCIWENCTFTVWQLLNFFSILFKRCWKSKLLNVAEPQKFRNLDFGFRKFDCAYLAKRSGCSANCFTRFNVRDITI